MMDLQVALQIVYDLASENILSEKEAMQDKDVLMPIREDQLAALNIFHDMIVNQFGDP